MLHEALFHECFQCTCRMMDFLDIGSLAAGKMHKLGIHLVHDGLSRLNVLPVLVIRGTHAGPTFGITAAVHGNELNGVRVIQQLFRELDPADVHGTLVGCPVVNLHGYLTNQRGLKEGQDLNRIMPGAANGNSGEVYAHRIMNCLIRHFDYLVDLHTASFGRANSLYVRVNMSHPIAKRMATLQNPEIIVHNDKDDGTLRRSAMKIGIPAITVEIGNPQRLQQRLIFASLAGLKNVLLDLGILQGELVPNARRNPTVCCRSYWIYALHGGILEVGPWVTDPVTRGQKIASVFNIFGDPVAEYHAPEDGIVIGLTTNPVCETGSRLIHLGIVDDRCMAASAE